MVVRSEVAMFKSNGEPISPPGPAVHTPDAIVVDPKRITPLYALDTTPDALHAMHEQVSQAEIEFDFAAANVGFTSEQATWVKALLKARDQHVACIAEAVLKQESISGKHIEGKEKVNDKRAPAPFSGEKFATFEWQLQNFLDDQFHRQGSHFLKWALKHDGIVTEAVLNATFGDKWEHLDGELYRQLARITAERPHNVVRSATIESRTGAHVWRRLKEDADRESLIQLDLLRSDIIDRPSTVRDLAELIPVLTAWEIKVDRYNELCQNQNRSKLSDDDLRGAIKKMVPKKTKDKVELLEAMGQESYQDIRKTVVLLSKRAADEKIRHGNKQGINQLGSEEEPQNEELDSIALITSKINDITDSINVLKGKGKGKGGMAKGGKAGGWQKGGGGYPGYQPYRNGNGWPKGGQPGGAGGAEGKGK